MPTCTFLGNNITELEQTSTPNFNQDSDSGSDKIVRPKSHVLVYDTCSSEKIKIYVSEDDHVSVPDLEDASDLEDESDLEDRLLKRS